MFKNTKTRRTVFLYLFFIYSLINLLQGFLFKKYYDPESFQTFQEICETKHYPFEEHFITTSDGYILRFFRLQSKHQLKIY